MVVHGDYHYLHIHRPGDDAPATTGGGGGGSLPLIGGGPQAIEPAVVEQARARVLKSAWRCACVCERVGACE